MNSRTGAYALVPILLVLAFLILGPTGTAVATSTSGTLVLGTAQTAPADFWGLDYAVDKNPGPDPTAAIGATPTTTLVYPGGNLTERTDFSTNTVYAPGGSAKSTITIQDFIATCRALSCAAIMELPMEINSPSTDAMEAKYVVDTLGFSPAFFLYGNEPEHWKCFGISWAALAAGKKCTTGNTSPTNFATMTEASMKAVDAALGSKAPPAMCLGGSGGQGPVPEIAWIGALQANAYDKVNCVAYAMHAHPAADCKSSSLSDFFATLISNGLPRDYTEVTAADGGKPLYMTEVGAVTPGSRCVGLDGTWAMDVFESAEVVQSMQLRFPSMGWWEWTTGEKDGLYYDGPTTMLKIYDTLFSKLGTTFISTNYQGQQGVYAEITKSGSTWCFLAVSTSTSQSFTVNLAGSGFPTSSSGTLYKWVASGSTTQSAPAPLTAVTLPPLSVVLVVA